MRSPLFRTQALSVALLMGALAAGAPTHHHGQASDGARIVDHGHHGHGVQVVAQPEGLTSEGIAVALPSTLTAEFAVGLAVVAFDFVEAPQEVSLGRPPPPDQPRAPPVSA